MTVDYVALQEAWCAETSYWQKYDPENPPLGQCLVTALLVQDILGGDIYGCMVGRTRHFYNVTRESTLDYTSHQFPNIEQVIAARLKNGYKVNRDVLLLRPGVADRYQLLKERYEQNTKL